MKENEFLSVIPFWNHLTPPQQQLLSKHIHSVSYKAGERIHTDGMDCIGLLYVKKGQLRTYLLSEDGREVTLYRLFQREICVLSASCVLEAVTFDVHIDAEENTELFVVPSSIFHQLFEQNIYVKCFSYELASARFSDVMWAIQQILFLHADQRLAIFLLEECKKQQSHQLKMTHEQIARYIGSAREVVSRMLKYFSNEGIVKLSRGNIDILDEQKLKQFA